VFLTIVFWVLIGALLTVLSLTQSRGGIISLGVIIWVIFKQSQSKLGLLLVFLMCGLMGWTQLSDQQKERYTSIFDSKTVSHKSTEGRIDLVFEEFALGFKHPIVGHGLGSSAEAKFHESGNYQASHNMYGEILIETGFVGGMIFFAFIINIRKELLKIKARRDNDKGKNILLSKYYTLMSSVYFMYALYSLNYFGVSQYYWYFFGGISVVMARLYTEQNSENSDQSKNMKELK
jgi:O-antigen ligase